MGADPDEADLERSGARRLVDLVARLVGEFASLSPSTVIGIVGESWQATRDVAVGTAERVVAAEEVARRRLAALVPPLRGSPD